MKPYALLLVASLLLAGCRAAPPLAPDAPVAQGRATSFSAAEFSFTYPATWTAHPGESEDELVTLIRTSGFALLTVQRYYGMGSLLELHRYEEAQAEGPVGVSESDILGGLPSFRVQSEEQVGGRVVTQVSAGALHHGRGYYVGYVYDPADTERTAAVAELEGILASWAWQ